MFSTRRQKVPHGRFLQQCVCARARAWREPAGAGSDTAHWRMLSLRCSACAEAAAEADVCVVSCGRSRRRRTSRGVHAAAARSNPTVRHAGSSGRDSGGGESATWSSYADRRNPACRGLSNGHTVGLQHLTGGSCSCSVASVPTPK
jgi:hypothetical protein